MRLFGLVLVVVCCLFVFAFGSAVVAQACPMAKITCWGPAQDGGTEVGCGQISVETKYNAAEAVCKPTPGACKIKKRCNQAFPNCCKGKCKIYWKGWQGSWKACPGGFRPPY